VRCLRCIQNNQACFWLPPKLNPGHPFVPPQDPLDIPPSNAIVYFLNRIYLRQDDLFHCVDKLAQQHDAIMTAVQAIQRTQHAPIDTASRLHLSDGPVPDEPQPTRVTTSGSATQLIKSTSAHPIDSTPPPATPDSGSHPDTRQHPSEDTRTRKRPKLRAGTTDSGSGSAASRHGRGSGDEEGRPVATSKAGRAASRR
jgi:hypothetical protein